MTGSAYRDDQYDDNYPDGVERSFWNLARNRVVLRTLGRGEVVLDVGCGRGIVVDYLREHGVDCRGCDLGTPRPLSDRVAPHLDLGRDATSLDRDLSRRVTTILLLDVLEHVDDPAVLLARCRAAFPSLARVVITVPARTELWSGYDAHFGHHRRYDLDSIRTLAATLAPRTVEARYFFHALYPTMRAAAWLGIERTTKVTAPAGALARTAHRLLGWGLGAEARWLPGRIPGSSILAVLTL